MKEKLIKLQKFKEAGVIIVLLLMVLIVGICNNSFFSIANVSNLLRTASYTIIIALPMTMVLITGGINLSVGSTMGLGGVIAGLALMKLNLPIVPAVLLAVAAAAVIGLINGFVIVELEVPAFMGTLGTMYIVRGIINVITGAKPVYPLPDNFQNIGGGSFLRLSYSVWFALILALIFHITMRHTKIGRYAYAVGGNSETARLSGINVKLVQKLMYIFTAICAAVTGIFVGSRIGSAQISAGEGWELDVIAACVIGGSSTLGGEGTALGTVVGGILMVVMKNAMILLKISAYWQNVIVGFIIIAVVAFDQYKRKHGK